MKDIIIVKDNRFKSVFVSVNMMLPLRAAETSKNALLAMVLKKSNGRFNSEKELERALANIYNTSIDVNVEKMDNLYMIQFGMEILNGNYIEAQDIDLAKDILCDFICAPKFVDGKFANDIFEREKASLIERIKEERDDKKKYALLGLERQMFKGTEYENSSLGTVSDVQKITNEELVNHYSHVIENAKIIVVACGNLDKMESLPQDIYNVLSGKCGNKAVENKENVDKFQADGINIGVENQQINQSVLTVGLRINNAQKDELYKALLYNTILGGTPASKLFQNVREKQSLAYFAKSNYNRHKQVIYIFSGIAPEKYEQAKTVIFEQVESLKLGDISDTEFNAAKQNLISSYNELRDSKSALFRTTVSNLIYFGEEVDITHIVDEIQKVSKEDVIEFASKVQITDVFLLGGEAHA